MLAHTDLAWLATAPSGRSDTSSSWRHLLRSGLSAGSERAGRWRG